MKILAIADTHGDINRIYEEYSKIKHLDVDLIAFLGDVYDYDARIIKELYSDVYRYVGVLGNHNRINYFKSLDIWDVSGKVLGIGGVKFGGLSGSLYCKDKRHYFNTLTQKESLNITKKMRGCDIFLSHAKHLDYGEVGQGSDAGLIGISDYIYRVKPKFSLYGHLHSDDLKVIKNRGVKTCAVGVYSFTLIDTDTGLVLRSYEVNQDQVVSI